MSRTDDILDSLQKPTWVVPVKMCCKTCAKWFGRPETRPTKIKKQIKLLKKIAENIDSLTDETTPVKIVGEK